MKKAYELSVLCDAKVLLVIYDKNNICHSVGRGRWGSKNGID